MKTEKAKMLAGALYDASDPQLVAERQRARRLCAALNASSDEDAELRARLLGELFGTLGTAVAIELPFYCDYGSNISLGDRVFFNFNCVILDPAPVTFGNDVLVGPSVQIYTATHPLNAKARRTLLESAKPIDVASDVWIGGAAILCPGVRIGARSVIGAGSVVTRDIPEDVFAAGNPCRVIRRLDP